MGFQSAENTAQAEAGRICQNADLLVDQLLVGWYGGVTVKRTALGKPEIEVTLELVVGRALDLIGRKGCLFCSKRGQGATTRWGPPSSLRTVLERSTDLVA